MGKKLVIEGGQKQYDEVTFLKGFSICTIVLMHIIQGGYMDIPDFICKAAAIGGTGSHIFLFCSGFGLYISYMRKPMSYFEFLRRRILKIYFPYIFIVTISAMIPFMYEGNRLKALLSHVFLYKMFIAEYESSFGGQLWYVSTLFQFYLIFIPICYLKERMKKCSYFLSCSMLLSIAWWVFIAMTGYEERIWESFFLQYFWEFALGMVIAEKLEQKNSYSIYKVVLGAIAICGIGIATIMKFRGGIWTIFNDIPAVLGYGTLALLIYSFDFKVFVAITRFISGISYELYLIHVLVFECTFYLIPAGKIGQYFIGMVALLLSFFMAYVYHQIIKRIRNINKSIKQYGK